MQPVATEMWLHVTAGGAAPGAFKIAVTRHFWGGLVGLLGFFYSLKYNHCLLFCSSLSLIPSVGLLPVPCLLLCTFPCLLLGLLPWLPAWWAHLPLLWHLFSCRHAAALKTLARCCLVFLLPISCHQGAGRSAHHSIIPLLLSHAWALTHYFKAWAHISASFSRWAPKGKAQGVLEVLLSFGNDFPSCRFHSFFNSPRSFLSARFMWYWVCLWPFRLLNSKKLFPWNIGSQN